MRRSHSIISLLLVCFLSVVSAQLTIPNECNATIAGLRSDPCVGPALADLDPLLMGPTPRPREQVMSDLRQLAQHLCDPKCDAAYRKAIDALSNTCHAIFIESGLHGSEEVVKVLGGAEDIKPLMRDSLLTFKDLVCLPDPTDSAKASGGCIKQYLDLVEEQTKPGAAPPKDTSPVPENNVFGNLPKDKICTPCTEAIFAQTAAFAKHRLVPAIKDQKHTIAVNAQIDLLAVQLDEKCGRQGFANKDAALTIGPNAPNPKNNAGSPLSSSVLGIVASTLIALAAF